MECNGEDDSKGIRKRKTKLPLKEESRDNGEKKENPDEIVSMRRKPIPASIWVGVLPCVAMSVAPSVHKEKRLHHSVRATISSWFVCQFNYASAVNCNIIDNELIKAVFYRSSLLF